MLLRNITLEDFGAYRGRQHLDLTPRPGKPVILIGGLNGCGKTTLLDAIQLALYGPRARCSGRANRAYDAYLRDCINGKANPEEGACLTLEFSVTVEGRERIYKVIRNWRTSGKSLHEFVNVHVDQKWDKVASENWADHIEDLLPLEIGSLFFFDGEKIESLADPDRASAVVESAINSLLGVNTVQQLRHDLLALQRRKKVSEEDQAVVEKITELTRSHEQAEQAADAALDEVGASRIERDKARERARRAEVAFKRDGGELFERQTDLEAQKKDAAQRLAATRESLRTLAAGALPLRLLQAQLDELRKQATVEAQSREAAQVLDTLVARDHELMTQFADVLPEDLRSALDSHLTADRRRREEASTAECILELSSDGLSQVTSIDHILDADRERAVELLELAEQQATDLEELERKLAGVPDKALVAQRLAERDEAQQSLHRTEATVALAEEAYETARARRDAASEALERAHQSMADTEFRAEEIQRIHEYCGRQREVLAKFKEALLTRHISRLEVAVLDSFNRLMRKSGLVRDLRIDTERFQLTLTDADGDPIDPGRMSAGERQLLAISLLWGLARVAGNWLPSVIDTPLGRLDSRHREHLVQRYFPHASHQVLLLSTDEEIDEPLLRKLKPAIAHTYTLVHDDTTFTTSVEPGYWWTSGAAHVA